MQRDGLLSKGVGFFKKAELAQRHFFHPRYLFNLQVSLRKVALLDFFEFFHFSTSQLVNIGRRRRPRHQKPRRSRAMGNEESTVVDDSTWPSVLETRSMEAVAKYIKEKDVKKIVLMVSSVLFCMKMIDIDFRA